MEARILQLISALRNSGVRISLAESIEAFSAVDLMGIQNREHFRISLRSTLIKDTRDLQAFDRLFPLFFDSGNLPDMGGNPSDGMTEEEAQMLAEVVHRMAENLRRRMERLMNGEPLSQSELDTLAALVGLNQTIDLRQQSWMAQRMQRALAIPQVKQALIDLGEQLELMGMNAERLQDIRKRIQKNMQGVEQQLDHFSGERIAQNLSDHPREQSSNNLLNRPFHRLTEQERIALQHEVRRLAAVLRTRIALRQKRAKTGKLDLKATIRVNQKYHGVPMVLRFRDRAKKPKLVVLCDISTSMRFCSELMLGFLFALQGQVSKTHAFAFIDHLEFVSDIFTVSNAEEAIATVLKRMPSGHYNTDLGRALAQFQKEFMDTINSRTTLIIVGDGRNNYNDPRSDIFSIMARRAARTIWLNPESPYKWTGDSDMPGYAPECDDVIKVGNLRELAEAVDILLTR